MDRVNFRRLTAATTLACVLAWAPSAFAAFPYLPPSGGNAHDPQTFKLPSGNAPNEFSESDSWKVAATPEVPSPSSGPEAALVAANNQKPDELCGVRGMSVVDLATTQPTGCMQGAPVRTAWQVSTGRPDVLISVLDSGIKFNDAAAMRDLRLKVHLNQGELPAPRHDLARALIPGADCSAYTDATGGDFNRAGNYDVNGDGVFNIADYACDSRVATTLSDSRRHGPPGMLTPEDLIITFSDGVDHDGNGFANDIAGWDFVDNTNDPYDDVQYGHGTGEARDSTAEADNGGDVGTCPNCMVLPLRVGESFIADANRFAQATLYATDAGSYVIQEALGTLNSSRFARDAIDYAYNHGVAVIASAADEAAEHHNQPGALPHTIVVNSVTKYASAGSVPATGAPASYLQLNGCTNFSTKIVVSVPSSSCSSEATGLGAGVAGLIYSAALNARDAGRLAPAGDCMRVDGSHCPISANEVRQLMGSGNIGSQQPADAGGGQADDVNFAASPEPACGPVPTPSCTDPNLNSMFAADQAGGIVGPLPSRRYHATRGFDEFYGYGRLNAARAVGAAGAATIPPEAEITTPDWFAQLDPSAPQVELDGHVAARSAYTCRVYVAPGGQPNNGLSTDTPPGDFEAVPSTFCDGSTVRRGAYDGMLAELDVHGLRSRFPASLSNFDGNENGGLAQTSNGRPNTMPYAFTVRVVVSTATGTPMSGEDRRQLFLHRDADALAGFPKELRSDGASSPVLVDLEGTNRNDLVLATSDGVIHAYRPDGSEAPGWPVRTDALPLHGGEAAYGSVGADHRNAVLAALAAGDLFGDGRIEVVAADMGGKVYGWDSAGQRVFAQEANPAYSGAPRQPFVNVRQGPRDRTEHGFLGSPVLADLEGTGRLDIVAAGEDRHLYAWRPDGTALPGFPVLVADPDKVASVDPTTHHLTFNANAIANPGIAEDQGKLVDTPAVATVGGKPVIFVGSNEEYTVNRGNEGPINAGGLTAASLGVIGQTGLLQFANGRLYAIGATGGGFGQAFLPGWPKKVGIIDQGLLPDVGEGITGSPVVASVTCPNGGTGTKIGVTPDAGPAYLFNPDGSSCYAQTNGADNPLEVDFSAGAGQYDHPAFAAVGYPAFGTLGGASQPSFFAPEAGLGRALDVVAPEYQAGQDFLAGWNPASGQQLPGFPAPVNDLQFLTGPVVGDVLGRPGQELIGGTASLDLQAFGRGGAAASPAWPKLTGDWTVATPTLGSFGSLDTESGAHKDVISITRSGELLAYRTPAPACSPSSWPRFHHDIANSGDYAREAVPPGIPIDASVHGQQLRWRAPGEQLLCGTAHAYQVVSSSQPITPQNFAQAQPLAGAPAPAPAGSVQHMKLPSNASAYVAIRAVDAAGSVGRPAVVAR